MDRITRVGVDLAKNVMQIHAVDSAERVVVSKAIPRERFVSWFANLEPCLIAMEACGAAHYWARKLHALGHEVRLIPPQFVAPYRKGGAHVKNDALDAEAVCEAASRPHMRFVRVKSPAQQSVLVLHRMRTGFVEERTALVNRLRGLLAEFGVFLPQGIRRLHEHLIERIEDGSNELTGPARLALLRGGEQWQVLDEQIAWFDRQIAEHANRDPQAQRCMDVCGGGPANGIGRSGDGGRCPPVQERPADGRLARHRAQTEKQRRQAAAREHHQTGQRLSANLTVPGCPLSGPDGAPT